MFGSKSRITTRSAHRLLACVAVGALVTIGGSEAGADTGVPIEGHCPALYVFGVQGGDEAPSPILSSDSGALGQLFGPLAAAAGDLVQRAYVPYGRGAGGSELPYEQAVAAASDRLEQMAAEVVTRCPATRVAAVGYAHGAPAASAFAHRVGTGAAGIDAEHVAGVALLANPSRAPGTPVLPGRGSVSTPAAAPGTTGRNVSEVTLTNPPLSGGGIAAAPDRLDYGALTGRVADLCVAGDATCDTPASGPLATTVANIAARSDLRDPIAAITTVAEALSATIYTTAVNVVNEDLTGTSLDQLSYEPSKPLGQRLAEASDPATPPPGPHEALSALFKLGTIGLGAVISVAQKVFTPATIAELATVGLANPWAAVATLGAKLAGAVVELVPPQTASRWINATFEAIASTITDTSALYTVAASAQYSNTSGRHSSYNAVPATTDGRSALAAAADWFVALARDLAATAPASETPKPRSDTSTSPTTSGTSAVSSTPISGP